MSNKSRLQDELNSNGYISRTRLYLIAQTLRCDFDTLRNYLEPKGKMGCKKEYELDGKKSKISGCRKITMPIMHNENKELETLTQTSMFEEKPLIKKCHQDY